MKNLLIMQENEFSGTISAIVYSCKQIRHK